MLENLGSLFKTYLTIINDCLCKNAKLDNYEPIFKAVEKEKTQIKADQKTSANFTDVKCHTKLQRARPRKKKYVEGPKCKKYDCKHLLNKVYKHAYKKCENCRKKCHRNLIYDK